MGFLHSSRARGRLRRTLKDAVDVRFVGLEGTGSHLTILHFEVPTFGAAAAEFFSQPMLWEDQPGPEETAFELFGSALNDVAARKTDSSRYDQPLLERITRYGRVLRRGVNRVAIADASLPSTPRIDAGVVEAAAHLAAATPDVQRVRIAGRLDLMGANQSVLKIEVKPGEVITALWDSAEPIEKYRDLFNQDVVLEGLAVFRPSGTLLRIDADAIAPASPHEELFRQVPRASVTRDYRRRAQLRPTEGSAYMQLLGSIPAEPDESEEEFLAALAALR